VYLPDHLVDFADLAGRRSPAHNNYEEPRAAWLEKLEVGRDDSHILRDGDCFYQILETNTIDLDERSKTDLKASTMTSSGTSTCRFEAFYRG